MNLNVPTAEQCSSNAVVIDREHSIGYAMWYPSMGGYAGRAVAIISKQWTEDEAGSRTGGCVDVYVWHDGEFPFSEGEPREIHHCCPESFVEFGETLMKLQESHRAN